MTQALEGFMNKVIAVVTGDGRNIVGMMKGFDQTVNIVLEESHERVYSEHAGVEQVPLGLYIIRGDNVAIVGEIDEDMDKRLDLAAIKAQPLAPIWIVSLTPNRMLSSTLCTNLLRRAAGYRHVITVTAVRGEAGGDSSSTPTTRSHTRAVNAMSAGGVIKRTPLEALAAGEFARLNWDDTVDRNDETVQRLKAGILSGDRASLAVAITLVESRLPRKRAQGNCLLAEMMAVERKRYLEKGADALIFRIGISGSPGVGKSSFIEVLGKELTLNQGKKIAVLTVDPSSKRTGGSLLGDLARMQELSRNPHAYIRQSPSSGALGGVARGIHEAVVLCEAAGYDVVLIETVGVGQSEVAVDDMVDMFCLLLAPAHGDELQASKRGVMEVSDLMVVTKADGDLAAAAKLTQAEYISALKFLQPRTEVWKPKVMRASIHDPTSITAVWTEMAAFWRRSTETGLLTRRREEQLQRWMWNHVQDAILAVFQRHPDIVKKAPELEREIRAGRMTPGLAAEILLRTFFGGS